MHPCISLSPLLSFLSLGDGVGDLLSIVAESTYLRCFLVVSASQQDCGLRARAIQKLH